MNTVGLFGQEVFDPVCGKRQATLFHEPFSFATVVHPKETAADRRIAAQYDPEATPPLPLKPKTPTRPRARKGCWLQDRVEALLKDRKIPYVYVPEAKKALFASATLKAFHFVIYTQHSPNWLCWAATTRSETRSDMLAWQEVFGEGFIAVFAGDDHNGESIIFRDMDGQTLTL